jgi:hypothetical protein
MEDKIGDGVRKTFDTASRQSEVNIFNAGYWIGVRAFAAEKFGLSSLGHFQGRFNSLTTGGH